MRFSVSQKEIIEIEELYEDIDYSVFENYSLPIERKIEEEIFKLNEDKSVFIPSLGLLKFDNNEDVVIKCTLSILDWFTGYNYLIKHNSP